MKKLILVYNPRSSHHGVVRAEVLDMARKLSGWMVGKFEVKPTRVDHNAEALGEILGDGDLVVVAGGDGTASIAVNAVMRSKKQVAMGVLGYGNFNDMAMTFGVKRPVEYGDEFLGGLREIVERFEANKVERVWPLEVKVDGEHWRYAMCYATCGMLAESTKVFDEEDVRKKLRTGRRRLIFSWLTLAKWYFSNRKKQKFLPEMAINGVAVPAGTTDYIAMNSDRMARVMRGEKWYLKKAGFGRATSDLTGFWRLMRLMIRSFRKTPVVETRKDVIELRKPGDLAIQVEGEYHKLEGVSKVEIRKAKGSLMVVGK